MSLMFLDHTELVILRRCVTYEEWQPSYQVRFVMFLMKTPEDGMTMERKQG